MNHKSLLFLLFLSLGLLCHAQFSINCKTPQITEQSQIKLWQKHYFPNATALYSNKYYLNPLRSQLPNVLLYEPIQAATIGVGIRLDAGRSYSYNSFSSFSYYFPGDKIINDSINASFTGYELNCPFAGQLLFNYKHFYFLMSEGISFGRIKLKNANIEKAKNAFLSPYAGIISGLKFSKLYINFAVSGNFDISSYKWKTKSYSDTQSFNLNKFNHSGLLVSFGLGYEI